MPEAVSDHNNMISASKQVEEHVKVDTHITEHLTFLPPFLFLASISCNFHGTGVIMKFDENVGLVRQVEHYLHQQLRIHFSFETSIIMYRIRAFAGLLSAGIVVSLSPSAHMDAQATAPKPKDAVATSAIVKTAGADVQLLLPPKETHVNVTKPFYTFDEATQEVTLDPAQYKRVDEEFMQTSRFKVFASSNALHDTLTGDHRVEQYRIYRKLDVDEIVAVVRFG
jgi:hypothetical protein